MQLPSEEWKVSIAIQSASGQVGFIKRHFIIDYGNELNMKVYQYVKDIVLKDGCPRVFFEDGRLGWIVGSMVSAWWIADQKKIE